MPITNTEFCQGTKARKLERCPYPAESGKAWAWERGRQSQDTRPSRAKPKTALEELMEPMEKP